MNPAILQRYENFIRVVRKAINSLVALGRGGGGGGRGVQVSRLHSRPASFWTNKMLQVLKYHKSDCTVNPPPHYNLVDYHSPHVRHVERGRVVLLENRIGRLGYDPEHAAQHRHASSVHQVRLEEWSVVRNPGDVRQRVDLLGAHVHGQANRHLRSPGILW